MDPVGRLSLTAIDCPDPHLLAAFYAAVTGWTTREGAADDWVRLTSDVGATLAFQQVPDYQPPEWPGSKLPQQLHLDFDVADLDVGEARVLALGATKATFQPDPEFRVFLDPAGHPFCLVLANGAAG